MASKITTSETSTTRTCIRCNAAKPLEEFIPTKSKFCPGGRSLICITCYERMVDQENLGEVDKLCQHLDIPFLVNQWTKLYKNGKERTLHLYLNILDENESYKTIDWSTTQQKWKQAQELGTLSNHIPEINAAWRIEMERKWPAEMERTDEDYIYLENFYNDLLTTHNITSATQRDDAKRLCEVGLLATQKIRRGLDAKNEMAIYHNIVKTEGFEPKNSKNIGDFDSVGEVYQWLYERGWKPVWHTEPQDSVDFTMKSVQNFLQRLVKNEGNISDQVEDRKKQLELAAKLEAEVGIVNPDDYDENEQEIEYEGASELGEEIGADEDWGGSLN